MLLSVTLLVYLSSSRYTIWSSSSRDYQLTSEVTHKLTLISNKIFLKAKTNTSIWFRTSNYLIHSTQQQPFDCIYLITSFKIQDSTASAALTGCSEMWIHDTITNRFRGVARWARIVVNLTSVYCYHYPNRAKAFDFRLNEACTCYELHPCGWSVRSRAVTASVSGAQGTWKPSKYCLCVRD